MLLFVKLNLTEIFNWKGGRALRSFMNESLKVELFSGFNLIHRVSNLTLWPRGGETI